ncbi:putative methyltransferase DDB_G0268948 [Quercus lobata]|uniref:Methyltransferase type 11 domain-containing protein n=1 Tax=Quercus lobata TaxID=97700 RepID=A0A7N2MQ82_QUELO|nr:putative methyltransferase DDB_G0268948 [Quercus lobata]
MAGLFDKQAEIYSDSRPTYPSEWFSKLAALTSQHSLAWDAGTGSGQAALAVAEYFKQVIGTDISEAQLKHATQHPRVKYIHTPLSLSDDELVTLIGGENSVDLVTVAEAVHWFELPKFYSIVTRLLRKPGGVIAIWGYNDMEVSPTFDPVMKRVRETTLPFYDPKAQCFLDGYRTLPFPFESVGLGSEGEPLQLDIQRVMSFEEMVRGLRSSSAVTKAKDQGVDLLPEEVIKELESAWGGPNVIKTVTIKAFMLAGKVKV